MKCPARESAGCCRPTVSKARVEPITIQPGEMISGRHRQAERSQASGEPKSGFVDDPAGVRRSGNPGNPNLQDHGRPQPCLRSTFQGKPPQLHRGGHCTSLQATT